MAAMAREKSAYLRFADLDALGHVNSLRLAELVEDARLAFLHELPQPEGLEWRLVSMKMDFRAQPLERGELVTRSRVEKVGNSSLTMNHEILEKNLVIAAGTSVIVQYDSEQQVSAAILDEQRAYFT